VIHALAAREGEPLHQHLRSPAEQRFGHSFEDVRIHVGPEASRLARSVGARAFTFGSDIVFGAGQFLPDTAVGLKLLWHELAHVASPVAAGAQVLRAPIFDKTNWDHLPAPPSGYTAKTFRPLLDAKITKTPPDIISATVKGVTPGSEAELFLEHILWQIGRRDRWGTVANLKAMIGRESGGIIPSGLVTVTIDDAGNATAELVSPVDIALSPALAEADAVKKLTTDFSVVVETGNKAWSATELGDVVAAFGLLPTGDKAALKGVHLQRFDSLPKGHAGEFSRGGGVAKGATTVTDDATLKLADSAFQAGGFTSGKGTPAPASYMTILHEVGHAVEESPERLAQGAWDKATIARNLASKALNTSIAAMNAGTGTLDDAKAKRKVYDAAVAAQAGAAKAFAATRVSDTVVKPLRDAVKAKGTAFDTALATATAAAKSYGAQEATDSTAYRAAVAAAKPAVDDYLKQSAPGTGGDLDALDDALTTAVAARDTARNTLKAASGTNPALNDFAPVDTALDEWVVAARTLAHAPGRSLRLQKFVDLVNTNNLTPVTQYAKDNWPHKPEEFYAESYSLWLNEPAFLKANYKPIFDFFDSGDYLK
jgi:hypothetical protein